MRSVAYAAVLMVLLPGAVCWPDWFGRSSPPPAKGGSLPMSAQAERSATKGPVKLTFRLYTTTIKAGESLWHQIRIQNVGKKEILIVDKLLADPWQLGRRYVTPMMERQSGIYVEVLEPDGQHPPPPYAPNRYDGPSAEEIRRGSGAYDIDGPKEAAMVEAWRSQGLGELEVNRRLREYNFRKQDEAAAKIETPWVGLKPGEVIETKSWFYYNNRERRLKKPEPRPIGDFAELEFFEFDKPGKYKVRAVYDKSGIMSRAEHLRRYGKPPDPEEVRVRTPWIEVQVLP